MYTAEYNINKRKEKLIKEKLLTIGIITKNECEKLERCLKSLMPLKDAFDCEIIVTDTGSTDNTVEMAKNYADQILHFDWCNDFAAARNTGVKAAKGLWFMWIDSDEWLEEPEALIKFFKSGEYKKYASATVSFIDYKEVSKKIYSHTTMLRLSVLYRGIEFKGRIHEAMVTAIPFKDISSKIYHDGYVFEDADKKSEKDERNLELLMERYNENPENLSSIRYLVDQYRFTNKYEKASEFCERGIALTESSDEAIKKSYNLHFKIMLSSNYINQDKYQEALYILDQIPELEKKDEYRRLDIYYLQFCIYLKLENEKEMFEIAEEYIDHYLRQDEFCKDNAYIFFLISNQKNVVHILLIKAIESMITSNKSDDAVISKIKKVLEKIKNIDGIPYDVEYISYIVNSAFKFKRYSFIANIYEDVNSQHLNIEKNQFGGMLKKYIAENKEELEPLAEALSKIDDESEFIKLIKFFDADIKCDQDKAKTMLMGLINSNNKIEDINISAEAMFGILKYNINFSEISKKMDIFNDSNFEKNFILEHRDFPELVLEYYEKNESQILADSRASYLLLSMLENIAFEVEEYRVKVFCILEKLAPILFSNIYNMKYLNNNNLDILPPIFRFAFYIEKANNYKKDNNIVKYLGELKNAFQAYPIMKTPILQIIEDIENSVKEEREREAELKKLAEGIERKIYELIANQTYEEALLVITQLQSIIPNDAELKELKSRIILKNF